MTRDAQADNEVNMLRIVSSWRTRRRMLGAGDAVIALMASGISRLTHGRCQIIRYLLVAQRVPESGPDTGRLGSSITTRRVQMGASELEAFPRRQAIYENRFEQGAVCYCAYRYGKPIGFIWFTLGPYEEDEVRCLFRPEPEGRAAWDFDVFITPEYRASAAFPALWSAAFAHMRGAGVEWTVSRISAFNPRSIAAHRRLGCWTVGRQTFLCFGSLQFMSSSVAPYIAVSWAGYGRPVAHVEAKK